MLKEPFGKMNLDFMVEVWAEGDLNMKEMALVQKNTLGPNMPECESFAPSCTVWVGKVSVPFLGFTFSGINGHLANLVQFREMYIEYVAHYLIIG